MIMGTASSVGKSVVTTGLCRYFYNKGVNVNPFKSQNMALNSFITVEGKEMGRAQVVQAEAAGKIPNVKMNPILIKPSSDVDSQIIVEGKILENMNASEYHKHKPELKELVKNCYKKLEDESELVILEGAGSPAEINLREGDLVNMGMAEISDSPVLLVGDIDKGGVFASLYGTIMLLEPEERARIKGLIINKFRGDVELLKPGLKMLEDKMSEDKIDIPFLGVIPWNNIDIEDEDSLTDRFNQRQNSGVLDIKILQYPHLSNYTDFTILEAIPDINVTYVSGGQTVGKADVVIIPGSKSVMSDFAFLKNCGWDQEIYRLHRAGKTIIGICGGYQMLGNRIEDPYSVEGSTPGINGLGLFNMTTTFEKDKKTTQSKGVINIFNNEWKDLSGLEAEGYEIHMGITKSKETPFISFESGKTDGSIKGNVIGTYFHGIFDNRDLTSVIINRLKTEKGIEHNNDKVMDFKEYKENEFNKLADLYEKSLDMVTIERIIKEW